jgi:hypothetical protein
MAKYVNDTCIYNSRNYVPDSIKFCNCNECNTMGDYFECETGVPHTGVEDEDTTTTIATTTTNQNDGPTAAGADGHNDGQKAVMGPEGISGHFGMSICCVVIVYVAGFWY